MSVLHSFLWLNNIPSCGEATFNSSIDLLMDLWVISTFWLLKIMQPRTTCAQVSVWIREHKLSFSWAHTSSRSAGSHSYHLPLGGTPKSQHHFLSQPVWGLQIFTCSPTLAIIYLLNHSQSRGSEVVSYCSLISFSLMVNILRLICKNKSRFWNY